MEVRRCLLRILLSSLNSVSQPESPRRIARDGAPAQIVALAGLHAVSPLVFTTLRNSPHWDFAPAALAELATRHQVNAFRSLALAAELVSLCRLFASKQILAVPLKGPALAAAAYGELGLRTFIDLDLYVQPQDAIPARNVLRDAGFQMVSAVHHSADSACLRSINAEFTMSRGSTSVDLHWRVLPDYFPFQLDAHTLWDGVTTQHLAGHDIPAFSPEHQLLYLAAHGAKHYWSKLRWACDFVKFLQAVPVNWVRTLDLAQAAGKPVVLTHALALVRQLFHVELPPEAARLIDPNAEAIAARVVSWILASDATPPHTREQTWFLSQFTTGFAETLRLWHGLTLAPTEAEWSLIQLPALLYPLYYPIRLGRMAVKYTPFIGTARREE